MKLEIKNITIGENLPFALFAGPCVVENYKITDTVAAKVKALTSQLGIPFVFKSSYKKANRTSINSFVSIGIDEALEILKDIKLKYDVPILTDVHSPEEIDKVKEISDIIQIPAFLCRQTDLLLAAGNSGKTINIKKGQFLAPEDMKHAVDKVISTGNNKILLTERGTTFGYHDLVVDMRSLVIMKDIGYPVVMDATHSVQIPSKTDKSSGNPQFIKPLAKAAAAIGIDALFLEVHPDPQNALSDSGSQLDLNHLESLLTEVKQIDKIVKGY